jgi:MarR family transcriptional regulator, organic hydroperoxide resistance regulator
VIHQHEPGALILELQRATHATLHALAVRLADLDLSASEINVLANLADGRSRSVGELASDTATKPTTLTSVLDRLERKGHVTRNLDPADRRSFRVSLTADGRRAAAASRAAMHDLERSALATISAADVAAFRTVAEALTATAP